MKNLKWVWIFIFLFGLLGVVNPCQAELIDLIGYQPLITLEKVDLEPAIAGGSFNLTLFMRNISTNPAYNLKLNFKVKDADEETPLFPFKLKEGQTTLEELNGGENRTLVFTFDVDPAAQNKDYKLVISLSAEDVTFERKENTKTDVVIPVTYDLTKPILMVESLSLQPESPAKDETFTVNFSLTNLSKTTEARNIMLFMEGDSNFTIKDITNRKNIRKLLPGATQEITYKLIAKEDKKANTVKLKIEYDYLGEEKAELEEVLNLPLPEETTSGGVTPWVIVNKYTLSAERILAGNTVALNLYIENTNPHMVKNVKVSLGVIKIEDAGGEGRTGGTVFSPVNSSNSFYVDSIPGKTIIEKKVDLYVDPNAAAKTYIVPVEIKYEDKDGKTLTSEELVNIPVTQECKLEVLDLELPTEVFIGEPVFVGAEFVNVGKVVLDNFMVTMEGDFPKENATYYVGNLDIGASEFYQGTIIPEKEGKLEGTMVFSYIDNNNQSVRLEKPFALEVMERPVMPVDKDGFEETPGIDEGGKFSAFLRGKGFTVFLFLVILIEAVYIFRCRRKKAAEEFFDE